MINQDSNQLFRLAAVLYADNNYEVQSKTIIRKVIECALLSNGNKSKTIHQIIDFVNSAYNLHLIEEEIKAIIFNEKENGFALNEREDDTYVCLTEKRKIILETKLSNKTIDFFIDEFVREKSELTTGVDVNNIIYRFLYEILSTNVESFKKLLDSKNQVDDLINVESQSYTVIERNVINEFLIWDNNDKNKAIFDIASYALEYCMISNNGNGTHIQLSNLKNKIFYLDTNVIYRALGINGESRQNRTTTFLNKVIESGSSLIVSKFSELELKDSITFYVDKLKKNPLNRPINPDIFHQKYFKSLSGIYDFYYRWRSGKVNDSLDVFEAHIQSLYIKFKSDFKVTTDYKIPFDEKDEKISAKITDLSSDISRYKDSDSSKHNWTGDQYDASNVLLIEAKREGKESNIFDTKQFFISTDQSLRRWDYYRSEATPIILLPSQWLSILLRYINRTNDDYKSFVSFLNLPSSETKIDSEKIHIILRGISEMTSNFDQQRFLIQSLIQRKFDGILENGTQEEAVFEKVKEFAKTELQKQVEAIENKHDSLKSELDVHKQTTTEKITKLELKTSKQTKQLTQKEQEVERLKSILKDKTVKEEFRKWQSSAYLLFIPGFIIAVFTLLQFCCKDWTFNYSYKIIQTIDTLESETQKNTLRALLYSPLLGLWLILTFGYNRLLNREKITFKRNELEKKFDEENNKTSSFL